MEVGEGNGCGIHVYIYYYDIPYVKQGEHYNNRYLRRLWPGWGGDWQQDCTNEGSPIPPLPDENPCI